jgi:hypothetical protein
MKWRGGGERRARKGGIEDYSLSGPQADRDIMGKGSEKTGK